jgi:xylulokinase
MAVIGIDLGTQSLKAVVVGDDFTVRGEASLNYQPAFPQPGWAEQDPGLWLGALRPAIGDALQRAGVAPSDVKGIGISGQLDGCVPTRANGDAMGPCIIWMDRRASAEVEDLSADLVRDRAGVVLDSTHMAAKIRWAARNLPDAASVAMWHQPVSFVVAQLCGRAVMDHALASTTMVYGLSERTYVSDLLDAFEIDARKLPEIDEATAQAGVLTAAGAALTGLPPGIPVAVGTGDDFANAIGGGVVTPGTVSCSVGTAEVVGAVHPSVVIDKDGLVETHGYAGGTYFISNPGWLSGGAVTWFLSTFSVPCPISLSDLAAKATAGCEGLLFLPALSGAMTPRWNSHARGAFYGLTPFHGTAPMARSVFEGCAFAMRDVVDRLDAMGVATNSIRTTGGGARSKIWTQIRADVTGRPIELPDIADASPVGAAILASVAAGVAGSITEATDALPKPQTVVMPNPANRGVYDDAYGRYRRLFDALEPMFTA